MDGQRRLWQAVSSARRSLAVQHYLIALQKGLLYAVLSITVIYFVSRFFVLPYYSTIGLTLAGGGFLVPLIIAIWQRPKQKQALLQLDQFYPHNELVTVLTAKKHSPLIDVLQQKAETQVGQVLEAFKKRPKTIWQSKVLSAIAGLSIVFLLLILFPAATQQEAKSIEEDRAITKDLKEKVKEQIEKPLPEETKKELAELLKSIEEAKTSEEALKEIVKKQKELTNLEQQLMDEAKGTMTTEMEAQLDSLAQVNKELAQTASEGQTALSKMGKPVDLNTQKTIASMNRNPQANGNPSNASGQQANGNNSANGQNNNSGTNNSSNSNNQGSTGQSSSNNNSSQQGSGQSGQSGQQGSAGNQSGNGQSGSSNSGQNGSGNGSGSGNGNGNGNGGGSNGGSGGLFGGTGSGGRDLLAIPQRVGKADSNTVDGGLLGDGQNVKEKGQVPATKGDVRPYAEVIGSYKDSYRQSADRLQLPSDLQKMVQNYFSSIEH